MKRQIKLETKQYLENLIATSATSLSCDKYDIPNSVCIGVGSVAICKAGNDFYLRLNQDTNKQYFKDWRRGIGGVISRSFKKKEFGNFYELKTPDLKVLLYKVDLQKLDEPVPEGETKLVDISLLDTFNIGDYTYAVVHVSNINGTYSNVVNDSDDEIDLSNSHFAEIDEEEVKRQQEDSKEEIVESMSLF